MKSNWLHPLTVLASFVAMMAIPAPVAALPTYLTGPCPPSDCTGVDDTQIEVIRNYCSILVGSSWIFNSGGFYYKTINFADYANIQWEVQSWIRAAGWFDEGRSWVTVYRGEENINAGNSHVEGGESRITYYSSLLPTSGMPPGTYYKFVQEVHGVDLGSTTCRLAITYVILSG